MSNLYLLPTPLSDEHVLQQTVPYNLDIIQACDYFIVEELKTARRLLRTLDKNFDIDGRTFAVLNEHTNAAELESIFAPLLQKSGVLMSEAGCPGIADPGAALIRMAHAQGVRVIPLIGPSSIIMAVMSSGLNGQNFAFSGYLPKEKDQRMQKIRSLEKFSAQQSQWFIETPYRNAALLDELLSTLNGSTRLCLTAGITAPNEFIRTMRVNEWKKQKPDLGKIPCVFGIGQ